MLWDVGAVEALIPSKAGPDLARYVGHPKA